ncbi:hypothetical protein [Sphingomonas sp. 2378]|uniref:hypothetical protein n=1 Tax=Sphingomonas sp. 2378 TaxID=1219748 RepID=UPI00311AC3E6
MPVLVTRADVLEYLAKLSSNMADGLGMGNVICDIARDAHDPGLDALAAVWKAKLPAPDLQIAAAQDAATYLRSLAAEDRIIAARTAADQAKREPTRG